MSTRVHDGEPCPAPWAEAAREQRQFLTAVGSARRPLLICDYDGTLAPFHIDKMQAHPYGGIVERLARLRAGGTELAFVSGRPVRELLQLLPPAGGAEIWGMHGREHQNAQGNHTLFEPGPEQRAALDDAEAALADRGWDRSLVERKVGSVAMHWRTLPSGAEKIDRQKTQQQARAEAEQVFGIHTGRHSMAVLPFDGGLELRTEDRTKAHAVEALLDAADHDAAAFLGDDLTDEDGFRAIRARSGLALLVRAEPRPSEARHFLRPPGELLWFLDAWIGARAGSETGGAVL